MSRMTPPVRSAKASSAPASMRFERQKQRVLDAATVLLNRNGVWGMTLQDVAAALDLGTSSLAYYFRRRDQLAAAVFEDSLTRLADIARLAGAETTPRDRVARYVALYFDHIGKGIQGAERPFAILSEIRAMDEPIRTRLIEQYQEVFRTVRAFFGPIRCAEHKLVLNARTHVLNETLFWAEIWLPRYPIIEFPEVGRRLMAILDGGLVTAGTPWQAEVLPLPEPGEEGDQQAFLRVATRLINDFGYKGASVERIAGELQRAKTTFYRHVEGKDELMAACFRESYRRLRVLRRLADDREGLAWNRIATATASALALQFRGDFPLLRSSALQAMPVAVRTAAVAHSDRTVLSLMGSLVDAMQQGSVRVVDPLIASEWLFCAIDAAYDLNGWRTQQPLESAINIYMGIFARGLFDSGTALL